MSNVRCPRCGALVPATASYCTRCGTLLRSRPAVYRRTITTAHTYVTPVSRPTGNLLADISFVIKGAFGNRPPLFRPSPEVYQRLPLYTIMQSERYTRYAMAGLAVGVIMVFILLAGAGAAPVVIPALIFALIPAAVYLLWVRGADRYEPEPLWLVALAFGWGAASTLPSLIGNSVVGPLFGGWPGSAGFVEEPLKILGVYLIATNPKLRNEFNDHLDGLLYGAAAGLGFGLVENILYIGRGLAAGSPIIVLVRAITIGMHMFCSGLIGWWMGYLKVTGRPVSWSTVFPALLVAMGVHALWNTLGMNPITSLLLLFAFGPYLVYRVSKMAKAALLDEYYWGYAHGYAPVETPR